IADAWAQAEREAAGGDLTQDRVAEILSETLKRLGQSPIERLSVRTWLESWLESKRAGVAAASHLAYSQPVREFLDYLGPKGGNRTLQSITERDIEGFIAQLRKEGRSAVTINKLVRKFLSAPFEKARRTGKIRYNPVAGTSPEKTDAAPKETFSG